MALETQTLPRMERPFHLAFRERRELGEIRNKKRITVDTFVTNDYLPYLKASRKSWHVYERHLRRFVSPTFGHRVFREIKRSEVLAWLNDLAATGYKGASCNRILAAFKALCSYAEIKGVLAFGNSPCYRIPNFDQPQRAPYKISHIDLARLMEALGQSEKREACALRLLILTGARKNEILHAKWKDVNWENGILEITPDRSSKPRQLPLSEQAVALLKSMDRHSEWLFPIRDGARPMDNLFHYWKNLRKELGLEGMRIEDFREINDKAIPS